MTPVWQQRCRTRLRSIILPLQSRRWCRSYSFWVDLEWGPCGPAGLGVPRERLDNRRRAPAARHERRRYGPRARAHQMSVISPLLSATTIRNGQAHASGVPRLTSLGPARDGPLCLLPLVFAHARTTLASSRLDPAAGIMDRLRRPSPSPRLVGDSDGIRLAGIC